VWVTLAGLARETTRIKLGSLMSCSTFRNPAHLAIIVAQIDEMSDGRIEFGLGAGSFPGEHDAVGTPSPSMRDRFDGVEEQLELITGLWTSPLGAAYAYEGKQYRVHDYPALVRPAQTPHPPIIIGGHGLKRTPALAARYANEYNIDGVGPGACTQAYNRVRQACEHIDRDPTDITFSAVVTVCCAQDSPRLARRRQVISTAGVGLERPRSGHRGRCLRAAGGRRQSAAGVLARRGRARVPATLRPDRPGPVGAHRERGVAAPPRRRESYDLDTFVEVVNTEVTKIAGATMTTVSAQSEDLDATSGESHIPVGEGRDAVWRIETRGVDYIPHVERNSSPRTVFWAFEGPQFSLGTYIFGGAMVAAGLSWWACVAATVIGVGIGSTAVSLVGMIGPRTGTNSTVSSGAFFGVRGRYLGSMLAQLGNLGFNVFTLWPAALATMVAMHRLVGTGQSTLALCIWMAVIGALCCLVSVLGHATLVVAYKWTAIVSCVVLVVFVVMEAHNFKTSFADATYQYHTFWPTWLFALSVAIVNPISYGVSVNDYTRRLPADTPRSRVFTSLFASIFSGNVLAYLFGAFTVLCYHSYSADFPTAWAGLSPMWFLVPIVIIAVVGNAIGGGINIYNASRDSVSGSTTSPRITRTLPPTKPSTPPPVTYRPGPSPRCARR
jgi:purine-cytosine permease-like protein/alkanesulfonate monooxygenase SsuD/methylene tetrahydromethanopterin reductase-like flavin-dependent oxidoreductase (luciferase family)